MTVVIHNPGNNGDVLLSRPFVRQAMAALGGDVLLFCRPEMAYLWADLGLPVRSPPLPPGLPVVNVWCGYDFAVLRKWGLTYRGNLETYNVQAQRLGLPRLSPIAGQQYADLPDVAIPFDPAPWSILVENGPCHSDQGTLDVNPWLPDLERALPSATFYCSAPPPFRSERMVDCSGLDLLCLSSLSRRCRSVLSKLSGITACTMIRENAGKPRVVAGRPLHFAIADSQGFVYVADRKAAATALGAAAPAGG